MDDSPPTLVPAGDYPVKIVGLTSAGAVILEIIRGAHTGSRLFMPGMQLGLLKLTAKVAVVPSPDVMHNTAKLIVG